MRAIRRRPVLVLLLFVSIVGRAAAEATTVDSCDATWLWPVPKTPADVDRLFDMDELSSSAGEAVWSDDAFSDLLAIVDSEASSVRVSDSVSRKIGLSAELRSKTNWKLVAFRIDPTAPGANAKLREQFGEAPQIRLILQPVVVSGTEVSVHDVAVHLVFSYVSGLDGSKRIPNREKFKEIVDDVLALKAMCADAGIETAGAKLGIHPGLKGGGSPEFRAAVKSFLGRHLSPSSATAMAIMGLESPEPWIFVATFRTSPTEHFKPLPIPVFVEPAASTPEEKFKTAEMLTFREQPRILPVPQTNNRNPFTANSAVTLNDRRGVSAATLFLDEFAELQDKAAQIGVDGDGQPVLDGELKNADIADVIANPNIAHFFNTDCVSCHVESQRRTILSLEDSDFAFEWPDGVATLDPEVKQTQKWNVRNLGWFPDFFASGQVTPTVSQRTANETAEVVEFINREYLLDDE